MEIDPPIGTLVHIALNGRYKHTQTDQNKLREHGELWVRCPTPNDATPTFPHYKSLATGYEWVWFIYELETVDDHADT